jgi:hypothetical protein
MLAPITASVPDAPMRRVRRIKWGRVHISSVNKSGRGVESGSDNVDLARTWPYLGLELTEMLFRLDACALDHTRPPFVISLDQRIELGR